jgi:hypothetical protein
MSPDFAKDFKLDTVASNNSFAAVLTKKNENGDEVH